MHHHHLLQLILFFLLPHAATFAVGLGGDRCNNRQCGSTVVPYPFGFSGDCPILLMCNTTISDMPLLPHSKATANYPVLSFNSTASTFLASISPSCNRPVRDASASLAGVFRGGAAGYAVSSRTSVFLRGGSSCRAPNTTAFNCTVPEMLMTGLLRTNQCRGAGNDTALTCVPAAPPSVAASGQGEFMRWAMVSESGCEDALTATVYGDTQQGMPSLQFGVAELGWWLNGTCLAADSGQCAPNATCRDVETPAGKPGHRCACPDGMAGDGFAAGEGCHGDAGSKKNKSVPFIVAGVLAGVTVIIGAVVVCRLHRRRSAAYRYGSAMRLLSEAASSSGVPVYTYHEVSRATNGFSHTHRLGTGAYGTVYVGKLPVPSSSSASGGAATPSLVAIKRLRRRVPHGGGDDDEEDGRALLNEIRLVSSVRHRNLVRLLGCCLDRGEHILVYEYVPNGTLSHHLHRHVTAGPHHTSSLPWRARLVVAAETAAAIAHLHASRIFHRDVKSSNILLDAGLRPKLADFGLSRSGHLAGDGGDARSYVSTAPQGTPGYVDPEYHQSFHLSDKSDVYSFGVVLLELVTAMKVVDFARPPAEVNLASLGIDRIAKGKVNEIVDPVILGDGGEGEWVMESVRRVSELAFRCLAFQKDVRPCMSEVAAELGRVRDDAPPGPGSDDGSAGLADSAVPKKAASPVSVHEVWVSDRSSLSTNDSAIMPRFL
ncbi:hypothetical protein QOZ80_5BG0444670 [Eleusine coracana subsp. coracana]|nr:hypothetical protein QOZ80_5BG0444670 [Eleusine coracana subsp. coracana]